MSHDKLFAGQNEPSTSHDKLSRLSDKLIWLSNKLCVSHNKPFESHHRLSVRPDGHPWLADGLFESQYKLIWLSHKPFESHHRTSERQNGRSWLADGHFESQYKPIWLTKSQKESHNSDKTCHNGRFGRPHTVQKSPLQVIHDVRAALYLNNKDLARFLGSSPRTVGRHARTGGLSMFDHYAKLAQAVHPIAPHLARELAATLGRSLADLGVHPGAENNASPSPVPPPKATKLHVDAVVCAIAEAFDISPRHARPAIAAIFDAVRNLDVDLPSLVARLATPPKAARKT